MIQEMSHLFVRDLTKLKSELEAYNNPFSIWRIDKDIKNSAGNLALHLVGNLNHFVGDVLCETGYKRDRESEFNSMNTDFDDIINQINSTIIMFKDRFTQLDERVLDTPFPVNVIKDIKTTRHFLFHLISHLNYHLGQINYHRRLLDE